MQNKTLKHFQQRLLEMKAELESLAEGNDQAGTVELDQSRVGRLSRMDALQGQQMALEAERRRNQQLRQVLAALKRIEAGDYGDCAECGEPIAPGRLEYNPAVECCINCAK